MMDEYLDIAINLAREAGKIMVESHEKGSFRIDTKSSRLDLVTEIDIRVERYIFDSLKNQFPTHRFIGEESVGSSAGTLETNDPTWIVDPIDGTMNFTHYSPWCCVSIGLAINKEMILGVINCPFLDRIYTAVKGRGAFRNGEPINVTKRTEISDSLILTDLIHSHRVPRYGAYIKSLQDSIYWRCKALRSIGSACISMCLVADGGADCFFFVGLKIWDMAAGTVIIREAGGVIRSLDGSEFDPNGRTVLCAGTEMLAQQISQKTREAIQQYRNSSK